MKLCQQCIDAVKEYISSIPVLNSTQSYDLRRPGVSYNSVPEPECEFWAHMVAIGLANDIREVK